MKPTVVILLSDKRSGSTMFQDELCKHPEIQTVDYSPHTYLETHHWLKGTVLLDMPAKRDPGGALYAGYGSKANARTYSVDTLKGNVSDYVAPANNRELIFDGWEKLCETFAKPVFFEKSPQYLGFPASLDLIYEWTQQTSFQVKFIGLTRNPLGVQYSAWKLFHRTPKDRQFGWMELQQEMLDFEQKVGKRAFLHVQYENIIREPVETFTHICEFIGVEPNEEVGRAVHSQSLTKWVDDPFFTLQLAEPVKAMARRFGYSDDDLFNPPKPEPPLSHRTKKAFEGLYKSSKARIKDRILKPIMLRRQRHNG